MSRTLLVSTFAVALVAAAAAAPSPQSAPAAPAEKIDAVMNTKIREEGLERSQIMRIEHVLTDVYGPRVTGTLPWLRALRRLPLLPPPRLPSLSRRRP